MRPKKYNRKSFAPHRMINSLVSCAPKQLAMINRDGRQRNNTLQWTNTNSKTILHCTRFRVRKCGERETKNEHKHWEPSRSTVATRLFRWCTPKRHSIYENILHPPSTHGPNHPMESTIHHTVRAHELCCVLLTLVSICYDAVVQRDRVNSSPVWGRGDADLKQMQLSTMGNGVCFTFTPFRLHIRASQGKDSNDRDNRPKLRFIPHSTEAHACNNKHWLRNRFALIHL